jgi:hypothetical protein
MDGLMSYSSSEDENPDNPEKKDSNSDSDSSDNKDSDDADGLVLDQEIPPTPSIVGDQSGGELVAKGAELKKRKLLPSAAALLSGGVGKPSFLTAKTHSPAFDIPDDQIKQESSVLVARSAKTIEKSHLSNTSMSSSMVSEPKVLKDGQKKRGCVSKMAQDEQKNNKTDVKDKLKAARLKGQSAHTRWKSEGEMLLRQQYD